MTYIFTDDPADPCAYDVQWRPVKDGDEYGPQEPYWPDGSVAPKIYRNIHVKCEESIIAYSSSDLRC